MKNKGKSISKGKKVAFICGALAALFIVTSIIWIARPKNYGVYSSLGFKMNADYILTLTVDDGSTEKQYAVPFSEYRAIFLFYKERVSDYIVYSDDTRSFSTDAQKTKAIKEATEDALVSYYSLMAVADRFGIGITDADRAQYKKEYDSQIAKYADTITDDVKYKGTKEEYAEKLYEDSLGKMKMTIDYFEFSYYKSLLTKRVKAYIGRGIEDTANESYFGYKQVYITYVKGDSASERAASEKIETALRRYEAGENLDALMTEYNENGSTDEIYFDSYSKVVGSKTNDTLGSTVAEMVRSLDYGEHSGIMSGEEGDTLGYYMFIERVKLTEDFVCGESPTGSVIYNYPYVGSSSYSSAYSEYLMYMDAYEQNISVVPVSDKVYKRIAVNTLY